MDLDRTHRRYESLQGILQFAIDNTKPQAGYEHDHIKCEEMEIERRIFLSNALKSVTVDAMEELEKIVLTLDSGSSTVEERIKMLNIIRDQAGNIDFANNFININGSRIVIECLEDEEPKIRICAAHVIAELSQNNPFCQKHFSDDEVLGILMSHLKEDEEAASSFMHAISTIVRNFEEGSAKFIEMGGIECILECLHSPRSNVFVKSCFLLRALATEYTAVRDKFVEYGAVQTIADFVDPVVGFDIKIETALSALYVLTQSDEGKINLRKTELANVLETLIELNDGKAECEEILRDSAALLGYFQQK